MRDAAGHASQLVLAPVGDVFAAVVATDATGFYPRFGPLPAVVEVTDVSGPFDVVGSHRMLHLSDGGTVTETVTAVDAPRFHGYRLTGFTGVFGRIVDHAEAEWRFVPEGASAARIRWSYTFIANNGRGWIVRAIVRLFWAPYMRRVLPPIARQAGPLG